MTINCFKRFFNILPNKLPNQPVFLLFYQRNYQIFLLLNFPQNLPNFTKSKLIYQIWSHCAGISGITAGNHFQNNNLTNFLILEAQHYIGGRIKQVILGNVTVGEGANWVHFEEDGDENPILSLANEINLKKYLNNEDDIVVK